MSNKNKLMASITAPGVGDLVRIEHHKVGGNWEPVVLHWHNYCELEIVTEGTGVHTLNNRAIPISRGDAFICMLDDFHTLKNTDGEIMKLINLKFSESLIQPNVLNKLYSAVNHRYCQLPEDILARFVEIISFLEKIETTVYSDQDLKRSLIESTLNQLLLLLLLQIQESGDDTVDSKDSHRIQKATEYIHKNFKENISEYDVAKHVNLSVNYFSTLFKKEMGDSFSIYIRNLRLDYAKSLIKNEHAVKVSKIADMSGFYSNSYFIKAFKRKFGVTPKEMIVKENQ